ncbi:MAG: DNA-3-methyladenine glycosylase [Chloroflexi bacterium]|nr:MAG: DNA-3-methyladenine glycosylase [Chloroflexota bacterium]
MQSSKSLTRDFFARPTLQVARELIGTRLVHLENGRRIAGYILEAEAYIGEADQGCHARAGRTKRTAVMYGQPGFTYVYFTYGMHWLLNLVTEEEGFPAAVLIRSIWSSESVDLISSRREGVPPARWTDGPGKITQAFNIDGSLNGIDVCAPGAEIFLEEGVSIPDSIVTKTPRVGLNSVPEPWKSIPWRFLTQGAALQEILAEDK